MNYAIPSYKCTKQEEGAHPYICNVEIGGIQYIGAASITNKEAEIKAARTALLAIKDGSAMVANGASQYAVLPGKKKGKEKESGCKAAEQELKPKKHATEKKWPNRKFRRKKVDMATKSENGGFLDPTDKEVDASMASSRDENEQGPGLMKDEPRSQTNELTASAMETNGSCRDEKQAGSTITNAESFEEPLEGKIMDSASVQDVKAYAVGNISSIAG